MNITSVQALVRASVREGEPAFRCASKDQQRACLDALAEAMLAAGAIESRVQTWNHQPFLAIPLRPDMHWRGRYSVRVYFDGDQLRLSAERHKNAGGVPLSGVAQLRRFWEAARERVEFDRQREAKRDKLAKLKERSAEAQIAALARRLGFSYATRQMERKLKLTIRLDERRALIVDVPLRDIPATLAGVERLYLRARALCNDEVPFEIRSARGVWRWENADAEDSTDA